MSSVYRQAGSLPLALPGICNTNIQSNIKVTSSFPGVMYGCESWTIKRAEHWRIDAFELWCWRRLFRVPWTARRSNQSIQKEFSPEYSLEGLMLKLKLPYFGHLMRRTDSLEKTLMLGKIEGGGKGMTEDEIFGWHHWLNEHEFEQALGVGDGQGSLVCCRPWDPKESDTTERLNWTELIRWKMFLNYKALYKYKVFSPKSHPNECSQ